MLFIGESGNGIFPQTYLHIQVNILKTTMTPEEAAKRKKEWVAKMKQEGKMKEDMTEDHKTVLNALQNPAGEKSLKPLKGAGCHLKKSNQSSSSLTPRQAIT
jgi:hypothetical protein